MTIVHHYFDRETILVASFLGVAWISSLAGCSGNLYTFPNPVEEPDLYKKSKGYRGILVYTPTNFVEISWLTAVLDANNKVLRTYDGTTADKKCVRRMQSKQVIRPDYDKPYQLVYYPGFLEKYNFKVDLEQGMLKSVGVDSSPDRGETFKNFASAAGEIAKAAAGLTADEYPCTHEPELKFIKRLNEICKKDVCDLQPYEPKK